MGLATFLESSDKNPSDKNQQQSPQSSTLITFRASLQKSQHLRHLATLIWWLVQPVQLIPSPRVLQPSASHAPKMAPSWQGKTKRGQAPRPPPDVRSPQRGKTRRNSHVLLSSKALQKLKDLCTRQSREILYQVHLRIVVVHHPLDALAESALRVLLKRSDTARRRKATRGIKAYSFINITSDGKSLINHQFRWLFFKASKRVLYKEPCITSNCWCLRLRFLNKQGVPQKASVGGSR